MPLSRRGDEFGERAERLIERAERRERAIPRSQLGDKYPAGELMGTTIVTSPVRVMDTAADCRHGATIV